MTSLLVVVALLVKIGQEVDVKIAEDCAHFPPYVGEAGYEQE